MPDGAVPRALTEIGSLTEANLPAGPWAERPSAALLAEVALAGRVGDRSVYTYRVPEALAALVRPGMLVEVPFGPRALAGIVVSLDSPAEAGIRLRDLKAILDPLPCLTPVQIRLAAWLAKYYACRLNEAILLMVPSGLDRAPVITYAIASPELASSRSTLTALQSELLATLERLGPTTISRLTSGRDGQAVRMALESMARRKLVTRSRELGRAAVSERVEIVVVLQPRQSGTRLTERQQTVADFLRASGGE